MSFIGEGSAPDKAPAIDAAAYLGHWFVDGLDDVDEAHWILLERDADAGQRHLVVGPYPGASAAHEAMVDSLLIDSLAEESCFDIYIASHFDLVPSDLAGYEMVLIDENEPAHHARSRGH